MAFPTLAGIALRDAEHAFDASITIKYHHV